MGFGIRHWGLGIRGLRIKLKDWKITKLEDWIIGLGREVPKLKAES